MARHNLYFKGFPVNEGVTTQELKLFFEKFGEIKNIKLCVGENKDLLGYGFVNFETLDGASKARFEAHKTPFRKTYALTVNQFELREIRKAK